MTANQEQRLLGSIPLFLADAKKSVETVPNGIPLGEITLRGWQLHRLDPVPPGFDGHAAYLVRANYEFDIEPGVSAPLWAEVEFQFDDPAVTVVDALPRAVTEKADAGEYELTEKLTFTPRRARADDGPGSSVATDGIALPSLLPAIDCFGIGDHGVRWRHSRTVASGTHTSWFVLVTPPDYTVLPVVAAGSYHVETEPRLKLRPVGRRDAFDVRLPAAPVASAAPATAIDSLVDDSASDDLSPRVFVSYAQESGSHKQAVIRLCALLRAEGVDVRFDQQHLETRRNWDSWTNIQILRSDYVIAVASPAYRGVGDGLLPATAHRGLRSEYQRLADLLHRFRETWTKRLLPVVLPGRSPDELPLSFLPGTGDYYVIDDFTPAGAADLLRVLHNGASRP